MRPSYMVFCQGGVWIYSPLISEWVETSLDLYAQYYSVRATTRGPLALMMDGTVINFILYCLSWISHHGARQDMARQFVASFSCMSFENHVGGICINLSAAEADRGKGSGVTVSNNNNIILGSNRLTLLPRESCTADFVVALLWILYATVQYIVVRFYHFLQNCIAAVWQLNCIILLTREKGPKLCSFHFHSHIHTLFCCCLLADAMWGFPFVPRYGPWYYYCWNCSTCMGHCGRTSSTWANGARTMIWTAHPLGNMDTIPNKIVTTKPASPSSTSSSFCAGLRLLL